MMTLPVGEIIECTSKFEDNCILRFLPLTRKLIVPVIDICDLIEFLLNDDSASWLLNN